MCNSHQVVRIIEFKFFKAWSICIYIMRLQSFWCCFGEMASRIVARAWSDVHAWAQNHREWKIRCGKIEIPYNKIARALDVHPVTISQTIKIILLFSFQNLPFRTGRRSEQTGSPVLPQSPN